MENNTVKIAPPQVTEVVASGENWKKTYDSLNKMAVNWPLDAPDMLLMPYPVIRTFVDN